MATLVRIGNRLCRTYIDKITSQGLVGSLVVDPQYSSMEIKGQLTYLQQIVTVFF